MTNSLALSAAQMQALLGQPERPVEGRLNGSAFQARVAIPHYDELLAAHYRAEAPSGIEPLCGRLGLPLGFRHFGLCVEFAAPVELSLYAEDLVLAEGPRALVAHFGPLLLRNVTLGRASFDKGQRNIFPHLRFHFDRGPNHENQYSLYSRDPSDPLQRPPRRTATVFIANIVAPLQLAREGGCNLAQEEGRRGQYEIFFKEKMATLFGSVVLEQPWDAADGTGEVGIIDNRTVLHASYHKDQHNRGYPIGTRYLF